MDLLNDLLRGATKGFDEPITGTYKGRRFQYKTKQRIHSFEEPIKSDVTATDEETSTSVNVHFAGPMDKAIEKAKEKLFQRLKDEGIVSAFSDQLKYGDLNIHETIGQGAFSEVFRVTFKRESFKGYTEAAGKKLNRVRKSEVDILRKVQHPNIVRFLEYIEEGVITLIVTELANESLRKRLDQNKGQISTALQEKWQRELAEAIRYLHDGIPNENGECIPIVHRDLKANNCLLFGDTLKVADFGISRETDHTTGTSGKGTPAWKAPEVFGVHGSQKFSTATDIYALGVLYWEIVTQEEPEARSNELGARDWGQPISSIRHTIPLYMQNLLPRCWRVNYKERPTIQEVIAQLPQGSSERNTELSSGSVTGIDTESGTGSSASTETEMDLK